MYILRLFDECCAIAKYADHCAHSHAFYVEYIYYHRKEQIEQGYHESRPAPGVYSDNVQTGGTGYGYGSTGTH